MSARRAGGRETWHRLREWDKAQSESERLAARLLQSEGYEEIDPSHPLGGPDGGRDITCLRDGKQCIIAVYFPRSQKSFKEVKEKFESDLEPAKVRGVGVFVFFSNQELTLGERAELEDLARPLAVDIFHLERIAASLDSPRGYGLRLEFVSIEMTKEEQLSFFSENQALLHEIRDQVAALAPKKKPSNGIQTAVVHPPENQLGSIVYYPFGSKLLECIGCKEVFRAHRMNPSIGSIYGGMEAVGCPSCGKVQRF